LELNLKKETKCTRMVLTMELNGGVLWRGGVEGFITMSPSQLDPCNLLCMSDSGAIAGKCEVKESSCCLPLEACGTSVGMGPSASTLIHLGSTRGTEVRKRGRTDDMCAMERVKEWK
jgi:hypothetical protein